MNSIETTELDYSRLRRRMLMVGLAALALCAIAGLRSPTQFFRSYLMAFIFWIGIALGCSAILMLHHLVGGTWGFGVRRFLESGTRTIWLMGLLVIPILFGVHSLYTWSDQAKVRLDPLLQYKHPYLNTPFFVVRTVLYFAVWIALAYFLLKWSEEQDRTGNPDLTSRLQNLSGPGLVLYGLTVTYASVDWVMSLEPHWFSTIYGLIFIVTQGLSAMAFVTILAMLFAKRKPLSNIVTPLLFNDYGNLLLTFTMLWAYLSFSQYLIIWSGNLQDEIPWYVSRATGGWAWVAMALIVFHFAVPFLLLLSRFVKRRMQLLAAVAAGLIFMSLIDMFWLTAPAFEPAGPQLRWMDWLATIGVGGIWIWAFITHLEGKPLLPLHDPRLEEILHHG
jgi:hypothetical protein